MQSKTILVLSMSNFCNLSLLFIFFQINIHEGKSERFYPNKTDNGESGFFVGEIFSKIGLMVQNESKKFSPILEIDEKFNSSTVQSNGHQIMATECTAQWKEEQDFLVHLLVKCTIVENHNATTPLPQDPDTSTWLVGALSVLLLVILIQFVWLTHSKGAKIDRYELKLPRIRSDQIKWERLIGSGQYGEVWLGKLKLDTGEIIPVALKQPRNKQGRKYLLEEAICLSNLQHENILGVRGLCMHSLHSTSESELSPAFTKKAFQDFKYHPVLVFEYVNGGSGLDYLKAHHKKVRVGELRKIALDILEACILMEEKHFVHRDIALRNILLDIKLPHSIRMAKLADFGLAKDISGDELHLYENPNCEIPLRNTAPEGISRGEFSTHSDVWSFGVLLWEMFTTWETGAQPVPYSDVQELMMVPRYICEHKKILPKPRLCPIKIYEQLLKPCWKYAPQERPTFTILKEILHEVWPEVKDSFHHLDLINGRRIENSAQTPMKKKYVKRIVHQMKFVYNGIDRSHKTAMKKKSVDITKPATLKKKSGVYVKQSSITDSYLSLSDIDDSYSNLPMYQNVDKTNLAYVTDENETSNEDNHHNNLGYNDEEPTTSTTKYETPTAYGHVCSNCGDVESANIDASILNAQQKLFDWIEINGATMNNEKLKFNICSWIVNEEDSEIDDQNVNSNLGSRSNSFETDDIEEAKSDTNSSNNGHF